MSGYIAWTCCHAARPGAGLALRAAGGGRSGDPRGSICCCDPNESLVLSIYKGIVELVAGLPFPTCPQAQEFALLLLPQSLFQQSDRGRFKAFRYTRRISPEDSTSTRTTLMPYSSNAPFQMLHQPSTKWPLSGHSEWVCTTATAGRCFVMVPGAASIGSCYLRRLRGLSPGGRRSLKLCNEPVTGSAPFR